MSFAAGVVLLAAMLQAEPPTPGTDAKAKSDWLPITAVSATADGGVTFSAEAGGSYLAEGENPDRCTYEFVFETTVENISAIRVETLVNPALPFGGPGRSKTGNYALSEIDLTVLPVTNLGAEKPIGWKRAFADFAQNDGPIPYGPKHAIDGKYDAEHYYAPAGHIRHEARELVFEPKEPFGIAVGTRWRLRLYFVSLHPQHAAGCLRFSITSRIDTDRLAPLPAPPEDARVKRSTERGIDWLLSKQEADGSWLGPDGTLYYGMTGLAAYTLLQCGLSPQHPGVRSALAYLERVPIVRTYDAGCVLMAYKAMGESRPKERVREVTRFLIDMMGNGSNQIGSRWGYPFAHMDPNNRLHWDLSNTQYAVLGLRAAALCGEKVPQWVWEKVAHDALELQGDYGSFSYRPDSAPTASMTMAGMTIVLVCAEQLALVKGKDATVKRLQAALLRAEEWLDRNWSIEKNVVLGGSGQDNRWYYYYLYGLERYGSISNRRVVGTHDWYAEASEAILRRQADDGSWATEYGEGDSNTCFALIMLKRGSRTTGVEAREKDVADADAARPAIASNAENPLLAWLRGLGTAGEARLELGERVKQIRWKLNGQVIATVVPAPDADARVERFLLQHALKRNGVQEIEAAVQFVDADGQSTGEETSVPLVLRIDNVEEPRHRETLRDHAAALTDLGEFDGVASSVNGGNVAKYAVDGKGATGWLCADTDKAPWIKVSLRRAVTACAVKVIPAQPYLGADGGFARPQDVEVQINGAKPFRVRLLDTTRVKQRIEFPKTGVKSVRIAVKSIYPGPKGSTACGFKEIELVPVLSADDELSAASSSRMIVGTGSPGGDEWRYASSKPAAGWEQREFDDTSWQKAKTPFADGANEKPHQGPFDSGQLWIRKSFTMDKPVAGRLLVQIDHDDGAEVFLNGMQVAALPTFSAGAFRGVIVPIEIGQHVQPGLNTLAVHCTNTGGVAWLDVNLIEYLP